MNENSDVNFAEARKKAIVVMIVTISLFTLIVGGISFAFFGAQINLTNNTIFVNASIPSAPPNKTLNITKTDCELNINMVKMYSNSASSSTPIANSNCHFSVSLRGNEGDYCTYDLKLENGSIPYVRSVSLAGIFEYSGTLDGNATHAETQMDELAGTTLAAGETITAGSSGVYEKNYFLITKFYNLPGKNQQALFANQNPIKHVFKITNLSCNFNH